MLKDSGSDPSKGEMIIDVDAFETEMAVEMERDMIKAIQSDMDLDPEESAMRLQKERTKKVANGWRIKWALGQLKREDSSSSSSSTDTKSTKKKGGEELKNRRQSAPMALSTNRLRRNETNVTSLGRHSLANTGTNQPLPHAQQQKLVRLAPPKPKTVSSAKSSGGSFPTGKELTKRSSLLFFTDTNDVDEPAPVQKDKVKPKPKFYEEFVVVAGCEDDSDEIVEVSPPALTMLNKYRCVLDPPFLLALTNQLNPVIDISSTKRYMVGLDPERHADTCASSSLSCLTAILIAISNIVSST